MTCSGETRDKSPARSDCFQTEQANSVHVGYHHVGLKKSSLRCPTFDWCRPCMHSAWWMSGSLITSSNSIFLTNWKYWSSWLSLTIIFYTVDLYKIWNQLDMSLATSSLFRQSRSQLSEVYNIGNESWVPFLFSKNGTCTSTNLFACFWNAIIMCLINT